jgi:FKBP-type peptidyl-prolyl cis-trans isomerase
MYKATLLFSLLAIFLFSSCKEQSEKDQDLIEQYIEDNGLETEVTDEGIHYIITEQGQGQRPNITSVIEVHYEGFTLDDEKFDSSYDRGESAVFPLANLIQGWIIGLQLIEEGGAITLIIPSEYAYGNNPPGGIIGRNEVLLFNLELIDVQ